jgi:Lamin Tail Domain
MGLVTVLLNCGFLAWCFTRLRFLDSLSLTHFAVWGLIGRAKLGGLMRIRALLVACLVAAASLLIATPAQAAPATVYISKVYYNSPGSDTGSNTSLNAEYVVTRNGDNLSHSISGWTVRDAARHVYRLGTLRLGAGKQAIIHTGKGTSYTTSASTHLYWGRGWYVWNNTGDKVILRRADGSLKDTCSYSGRGSVKYC